MKNIPIYALLTWVLVSASGLLGTITASHSAQAQVIPDQTLPTGERSQVVGDVTIQIDGGATRGSNLFHSFSQFSVPTGGSVFFNNDASIQNIFSRVTGGSISSIDGLIRANGTANLFLLNPNGILFGPNAQLEIGGALVASTADRIVFADGSQYIATNSEAIPLLTVTAPTGLQMGQNSGQIVVQGDGHTLLQNDIFSSIVRGNSAIGLRVVPGQTLTLVGGDIQVSGGLLTAVQGRIELGSIREGQVGFSSNLALDYSQVREFGDIELSQQALADASGAGEIQIHGNQVSLLDGSLLLIQNQGLQQGGSIRVNSVSSLDLVGVDRNAQVQGGLQSQATGSGRGADIVISSRRLTVQAGAVVSALTFDSGQSGSVTVSAADSIDLIGVSAQVPKLYSTINTFTLGAGNGANVSVSTGRLRILGGANVAAATDLGNGNSGDVTITATESVEIIGASTSNLSNVNAAAEAGSGNAGNVTITTRRLVLNDGGVVVSTTLGSGSGGSVTIDASESIEVSGSANLIFSTAAPDVVISFPSQIAAASQSAQGFQVTPGTSGSVTIRTGTLSVTNGAAINVDNQSTSRGGNLTITAESILVDQGSSITAITTSDDESGGNVNLQIQGVLFLRRGSQITTSAAGTGTGGNIRIAATSVVAVPKENSDIRADSADARGGNVIITADGLFGIQFRPQATPLSDITATGANSAFNGTVQLNIERTDFSREFIQLPTDLMDVSGLIAQGCREVQGSSFVVTGRGGLPPGPEQPTGNDPLWRDRRSLPVVSRAPVAPQTNSTSTVKHSVVKHSVNSTPPAIVEADQWVVDEQGTILLTATTPATNSHESWNPSVNCNGL